jgi:tetratricopeptide (TPR) repeat protein
MLTYVNVVFRYLQHLYENKRTRFALFSMGILLFLAVGLPWGLNAVGMKLYGQKSYAAARIVWDGTSFINWQQKGISEANAGDAFYQQNSYENAIKRYESALKHIKNPYACKVRWNMMLAFTQSGDLIATTKPIDAITLYAKAINALSEPSCLNDQMYHKDWQDKIDELNKKIAKSSESMRKNKTDQSTNTDPKQSTDADKAQLQNALDYEKQEREARYNKLTEQQQIDSISESVW